MDFKNLYLSFNGRIRRSHYWIGAIVLGLGSGIVIGIIATVLGVAKGGPLAMVGMLLCGVVYLGVIWAQLALMFKRIHDRDRGAVFLLLGLIPLVNFWVLIELLFLDGTPGPNKFGPSPKGIGGEAAAVA